MLKVHLGSGPLILPGWVNVDNLPYPGVDRVLDVTKGLPFKNVDYVFAEHFIEHIPYPAAIDQFLYNELTLRATLHDAGFATVVRVEYGQSSHEALRGLERHEKSADWGMLSSILIVEASGRGGRPPEDLGAPRAEYLRDIVVK